MPQIRFSHGHSFPMDWQNFQPTKKQNKKKWKPIFHCTKINLVHFTNVQFYTICLILFTNVFQLLPVLFKMCYFYDIISRIFQRLNSISTNSTLKYMQKQLLKLQIFISKFHTFLFTNFSTET